MYLLLLAAVVGSTVKLSEFLSPSISNGIHDSNCFQFIFLYAQLYLGIFLSFASAVEASVMLP